MPSGRAADRDRRRRRGESSPARRPRARRGGRGDGAARTPGKRPGGKGSVRARPKASTGGAFKLSSTRRAAVLALLVCALALSVSVPLRTYLSQQAELEAKRQLQAELSAEVRRLEQRKTQLSEPAQLEAEARERLGYVRPGETPYVVQLPSPPPPHPPERTAAGRDDKPWYQELWESMVGKG